MAPQVLTADAVHATDRQATTTMPSTRPSSPLSLSLPAFEVPSIAQQLPPVSEGCTRLYLCRHGQTEYNRQCKYQGRGVDTVLNGGGLLQATCLAHAMRNVPLRAIYSSSLRRAQETASIVAKFHPKIELEQFRDLEEMSFGVMEGKDHSLFHDQVHAIHQQWDDGDYTVRFPSGECPLDVVERGVAKITELVKRAYEREHVLIVAHGRFNKVVLAQMVDGNLEKMHDQHQDNTCVNVVDFDHKTETFRAVALNNTIHLPRTLL
ncbi:hypothetical protein Poli38472_012904 [Pythium oligandrum]|uniref:Phosphoglycerate mutase n=1 Tax=Pythium oligandrum TaxID=41045 RepID=A0A8K1CIX6_PYTOL|nr:hypothetical protein Poli38472_012904 [Pythium oligandrum]|eukprot:TMW64282.1 hypothetical protein Poli38472_012904 [Pythium oligandrum]